MGKRKGWTSWVRAGLAIVLGYAVYAGGLMSLVYFWFISERAPLSLGQHIINGAALIVLGIFVALATRIVAGGSSRIAIPAVLLAVLAVGAVNLSLGVAVEPTWFTMSAMAVVGAVLAIWWRRLGASATTR